MDTLRCFASHCYNINSKNEFFMNCHVQQDMWLLKETISTIYEQLEYPYKKNIWMHYVDDISSIIPIINDPALKYFHDFI